MIVLTECACKKTRCTTRDFSTLNNHYQLTRSEERMCRDRLRILFSHSGADLHKFSLAPGTNMQEQFVPRYFGIAFAFMFKYCTGMPDMPKREDEVRFRRDSDAPRVEPQLWIKLISRRIEQQLRRDWSLGFTMGNYLFRSRLNLTKSAYRFSKVQRDDGSTGVTAKELEDRKV